MTAAGTVESGGRVLPGKALGSLPLPAGVDPLVLELGVGRITALRSRPLDADGHPVVSRGTALLVPGFTGSKEDHRLLLPLLAAHGWDAWAFSQRGQADSAAPEGAGNYRLEDFADDTLEIAALLASMGDGSPVHLLGHSFGGVIARAAAIAGPERFASLTMLCSGPHGWPDRKTDVRARLLAADGTDLWLLDNPELADLPDGELSENDRFLRERSGRTSVDHLLGAISILADPRDSTEALAETGLPVLVAHGEDDAAWPQVWQASMARRLDALYEVIPDAGHLPNVENPSRTVEVLHSFWSAVSGSSARTAT